MWKSRELKWVANANYENQLFDDMLMKLIFYESFYHNWNISSQVKVFFSGEYWEEAKKRRCQKCRCVTFGAICSPDGLVLTHEGQLLLHPKTS